MVRKIPKYKYYKVCNGENKTTRNWYVLFHFTDAQACSMDGRSMIRVLNVVENILESSHVDDQPERIQVIPWPTLTRAISVSHTRPRPPRGSLNFETDPPLPLPRRPLSNWLKLFLSQTFSHTDTPTILKFSHYLPTCLWRWNRQSVLKHRHIKFRHRGITQKKTYSKLYLHAVCRCVTFFLTKHKNNSALLVLILSQKWQIRYDKCFWTACSLC